MANEIVINIQAQVEKALKGINSLEKEFSSLNKTVKTVGITFAGVFAASKAVDFLQNATEAAARFENSLIGVQSVAQAFGISTNEVTKAVNDLASDGLVPVTQVAESLKNLLATGFNLQESVNLFNALKDSASFGRQGFLTLGEAIAGATSGIKNNISVLLDNAGITKNISVIQKEYATSIGTTIGRLTEAEKRQALLNGILKEASIFSGDATKLSNTYSGAIARLDFSYNNLLKTIGSFITESPEVSKIISTVAASLNDLSKSIANNSFEIKLYIKVFTQTFLEIVSISAIVASRIQKFFASVVDSIEIIVKFGKSVFLSFGSFAEQVIDSLLEKIGQEPSKIGLIDAFEKSLVDLNNARLQFDKNLKQESGLDKLAESAAVFADKISDIKVAQESATDSAKKFRKTLEDDKPIVNLEKQEAALEKIKDMFSKLQSDISKEYQINVKSNFDFLFQTNFDEFTKDYNKVLEESAKIHFQLTTELEKGNITQEQYLRGILSIQAAQEEADKKRKKAEADLRRQQEIAFVGELFSNIARGAEGARNLVADLAKNFAEKAFGPAGKAFGPLIDAFTQGPEAVRQLVTEFTQALPKVIEGFILAIPAFIEALVISIPQLLESFVGIIDSLVEKAPEIITGIVENLPTLISSIISKLPEIVTKFAIAFSTKVPTEFIKQIPNIVVAIVKGLYDGISQIFNNIIEQIKNFLGDPISSVGDFFGFAKGGQAFNVTGGVSGRDSVPALLTPGELVVDRSTAFALKDFLANQNNESSGSSDILLARILNVLEREKQVKGNISINIEKLEKTLLEIGFVKEDIFDNLFKATDSQVLPGF